jgi:hypothetical protein
MLFGIGIILSETLFDFENPVFWIEFSYLGFWNHRPGNRIQPLDDPKVCWMNILRTGITMQREGLNGTGRRHVVGPSKKVLAGDNPEIRALYEMAARLMMGRIENEEMSFVMIFHRSRMVVVCEPG